MVQGEAAACIHAMEQQLAEMERATSMVETQRDEAIATVDKWMKRVTSIQEANEKQDTAVKKAAQAREEALKQESSDRVNQAVEKLLAEHQQAMQAFHEECEASIEERLSKQKDAYHVNVIYTGPGMRDFEPRHFDFLWVQWFEVVNPGLSTSKLDMICFPPMNKDFSFSFVDPKVVLHGCHILPAFAQGKQQKDGIGISYCAKDGNDYNQYFVGWWVYHLLANCDFIISSQVL